VASDDTPTVAALSDGERLRTTSSDRFQHAPDVTFLAQREAAAEKPE
jgi:hypothetical protein